MNSVVPKQFIELAGKPVLMRTMEKFAATIPEIRIIVVLSPVLNEEWKWLCAKHNFVLAYETAAGGETRYHSVKNGLALVAAGSVVGIHDAARPLVSTQTILSCFETAERTGNACPVVPMNESVRYVDGNENNAVDRSHYVIVQTPQCFHTDLLKAAFEKPYKPEFTDDASVLEANGGKINLVNGNRENIKITTQQDLVFAEAYMNSMAK